MPTLRPFRDVSEHDVINLFQVTGMTSTSSIINKGTFVKVQSGWAPNQNLVDGGAVGGFNPPRTVSRRWSVPSYVGACDGSGNIPLGITLMDVRELDENGLPLIFNRTKQTQLQAVLSGEACPIATRGLFLYSGYTAGTLTPGQPVYLNNTAGLQGVAAGLTPTATKVGMCLGIDEANNWALVKINVT